MNYYRYEGHTLCAWEALPYERIGALPGEGEIIFLFAREMLAGRESFPVTDAALLTEKEGVETLDASAPGPAIPAELEEAIRTGRVRAVNRLHPRWQELLSPPSRRRKYRVNLLGLGDVGSTLLQGLRLLGGDIIASIGICDLRENVPQRWEFELNQIGLPWAYDDLPPVEIISPEQLFDGDVFLFCASRMVPDTSVTGGDVRMAQYGLNRELAASYARMARDRGYQGLFCVVSDPVDPLCRAVLRAGGGPDGTGLRPCQVRGFGLGVMHARALYFARKDPRFAAYLTEGRAFGPHGEDLVLANSIDRYDDALSRELTERVAHANLEMRKLGFKPYVAPALSSGALSLLALLRREGHYSSVYMDDIFMGCRNRLTPDGAIETEHLTLPPALEARLAETAARLRAID